MIDRIVTPAIEPVATLLLAHGSSAAMDHPLMTAFAEAVAAAGVSVVRFEFRYRAAVRSGAARRPPPPVGTLVPEFADALAAVLADTDGAVLIGGKSMGGRVAAMLAGEPLDPRVRGVVCWGYPFHKPGQPDRTRLTPLAAARLPVLILQGTRDEYGGPADVAGYDLPPSVRVAWFEDGDHHLAPRKASGVTVAEHLSRAADLVSAFAGDLVTR